MYQKTMLSPSKLKSHQLRHQAKAFRKTKNLHALSRLLNTSTPFMHVFANNPRYQQFYVAKSNGGQRLIENPNEPLKKLQQRLAFFLSAIYFEKRPDCAHGFIKAAADEPKGRGIYSNALQHANSKWVFNLDLRDFFHSISRNRVRLFFRQYPMRFSKNAADCLAGICTYQGRLPMGAPTSPVLSNLVCIGLDKKLMALAADKKWVYTRYADDLTFSAKKPFKKKHIQAIRNLIREAGFIINEDKVQKWKKGERPEITGLILKNKKPDLKKDYLADLQRDIDIYFYLQSQPLKERRIFAKQQLETYKKSIIGQINFVGQVKGKKHKSYKKLAKQMGLRKAS
ncbi:MAG: reverse transcriptase family protein [Bacteroidota bacterium]